MQQTLTPRDLAEAVGMSESSLKRWADEGRVQVSRTVGGHRRITLREAVRFIRASGLPIVNPRVLGIADLDHVPADLLTRPESADQPLVDAIINGHPHAARGLALSMYLGGRNVSEICDGPMTRAMHCVGDLWKHSADGILIEHRANDICAQAINLLRGLLPAPASEAPLATGGTPPGDQYLLPSLMAATVLAAEGWREENLGPDLPLELLARSAERLGATLVWLSVSVEQPAERLAEKIVELGQMLAKMSAALVVGGQFLPSRPLLVAENIHVLSNMSELAAFAKGLRRARLEAQG